MSRNNHNWFAKVPVHVLVDRRLKGRHIRVLIALYLFADQNGFCFPKRETVSELIGIRVSDISMITTHLEELGWLTKTGNGGKSRANRYQLKIPDQLVPVLSTVRKEAINLSRDRQHFPGVARIGVFPVSWSRNVLDLFDEGFQEIRKFSSK